jgi:NFU1 iron-sulfur cluster scaffold homolog, mitochondrial
MEATVKSPVLIYTEQTPNPESLKFVTNRMLFRGTAEFKELEQARLWSPLAEELYSLPFVKSVYICNNFITVTKEFNFSWDDIMLKLKENLKTYLDDGKVILNEGYEEAKAKEEAENMVDAGYDPEDATIVTKIKELIETYVKPAVEMDGGNIEFRKFENGAVYLAMQGSCSGCPSSTVTLKTGIEGMLMRMVPEVKEVHAIAE